MRREIVCLCTMLALSTMGIQAQNDVPQNGFPGFGGGFPGFGEGGGFGQFGGFPGGEMPDFSQFDMSSMFGEMPEGATGHVDFESSDLPLIQIFTDSLRITKQKKITARMKITDNGAGRRNRATDKANNYDGLIGIKIRGNSSAAFTQKRFTIETRDAEGKSLKASLLGMPADDDWVLLGPYNDRSMMRDAYAFDLWREMGHWGSRSRYAELLLNSEYRGVYLVVEKIKKGAERVNLKAQGGAKKEAKGKVTGGYILRVDAADADCANFRSTIDGVGSSGGFGGGMMGGFGFGGFGANGGNADQKGNAPQLTHPVTWSIFYPKKDALQPEQQTYIQDYVAKAEQAIHEGKGYEKYIDVASFVDYFIHTELSLNADGFKRSAYFYKEAVGENGKGGLLKAGPVWDYNLAYGNCNFCSAGDIYAWVYNGCETNPTPAMWKDLAGNTAFMKWVKARYAQLRNGILSKEHINAYIDERAQLLAEAQERHFTKYPTLLEGGKVPGQESNETPAEEQPQQGFGGFGGGFGGFGGMMGFGGGMGGSDTAWFDAYAPKDFADEISILKKWMSDRIDFLDSQWK